MADDGVVKYQCRWEKASVDPRVDFSELIACRQRALAAGWMGLGSDDIGFGNLSQRIGGRIWISGTQTGHLDTLGPEHFCEIIEVDIAANRLACRGPVAASSESLSHLAIYQISERLGVDVQAVIHAHDARRWAKGMAAKDMAASDTSAVTDAKAAYGTPAMGYELQRVWEASGGLEQGAIVMGGHEEGLIGFGPTLQAAFDALLRLPV